MHCKTTLTATLLAFAPGLALAGPNAAGTLLLHTNSALVYCSDQQTYCGQSGLTACEATDASVSGTETAVFFAVASFPPASSPRLSGITFGVNYPTAITLVAYGACGDFELATANWPASGEGTALTWNAARTTHLVETYWFAGYNYYAPTPAVFSLTPHPTQGAMFADDSVPAQLDAIAGLGALGFDAPGVVHCPITNVPGACCFADGTCLLVTEQECATQQGSFLGAGVSCDPNPCPQPSGACCHLDGTCTLVTLAECNAHGDEWFGPGSSCTPSPCPPLGACCFDGGICEILPEDHCIEDGGAYVGDGTACSPDPCSPVATEAKSWGEIKASYR